MEDIIIGVLTVILLFTGTTFFEHWFGTKPVIIDIVSVEWHGSAMLCLFYGVTVTKTWYHHFHKQTCTEHIIIADSVLSRAIMDIHSREVLPNWIGDKLVCGSTIAGAWKHLDEGEIHSKIKEE